ncbi:MAG TPA: oligosaccharyl transferase, archaeosortase A system-associated, partial [Dehalococcoidia bacterium]|nr:oligosaccharyl transferase, archaeosortase A system-associated [Dehalococcoidia bacterium]
MSQSRFSPKLIIGIVIALFFVGAICLRVIPSYDQVFGTDWTKFTSADAYYHMRLVDNLVQHFPDRLTFDAYTFFPRGSAVTWPPFFDWLLAGIIWLVGLGSPTQHVVDTVGALLPAVLGALTVIPVYFIGKTLWNRWVGVISAGLVAILPGEFLGRSALGFTDHHIAETLFSTVAILFLILAIKSARQRQLTFKHLVSLDWATMRGPLIYSLLAGIFLGIYLLTWMGALLFVFIVFIYFIIQSIIDHLRHESSDYLSLVGVAPFLIALMMFLPFSQEKLYIVPLIIALLAPLLLNALSRLMAIRNIKRVYLPVALVVLGLAAGGVFQIADPSLLKSMLGRFVIFTPGVITLTVMEGQPLLFPTGSFSFSLAWASFTTSFFLSIISLVLLIIYFVKIKRVGPDKALFVIWSLVILAAVLGQRRFGYYFTVNAALLTGYVSALLFFVIHFVIAYLRGEPSKYLSREIIENPALEKLATKSTDSATKRAKRRRARPGERQKGGFNSTVMAVAIVIVFCLSFAPNISPAVKTAGAAPFAPSDAWCSSLSWLRENTPDPFGNAEFYYEFYEQPPRGQKYEYPDSAYGIMAWWDYGHWITRIARRLPNHGPGGGWNPNVARFFTTQDEAATYEIIDKLKSKYVVVDYDTATAKFYALATWAGSSKDNFYEIY